MKHDDIVGEVVPEEEAAEARNIILQLVRSHTYWLLNTPQHLQGA